MEVNRLGQLLFDYCSWNRHNSTACRRIFFHFMQSFKQAHFSFLNLVHTGFRFQILVWKTASLCKTIYKLFQQALISILRTFLRILLVLVFQGPNGSVGLPWRRCRERFLSGKPACRRWLAHPGSKQTSHLKARGSHDWSVYQMVGVNVLLWVCLS